MSALDANTDALAILPKAWAQSTLLENMVAPIPIRERLAAPDLQQVWSHNFPLTPAAEQLSLLLQRAAGDSVIPGSAAIERPWPAVG